jgi:superfamily I DNA/RNA helicase
MLAKSYRLPSVWSAQQTAFIQWGNEGKGSVILQAVAGAGKTTTILGMVQNSRKGNIAIMAYNKKIADEIKAKLVALGVDWKHAQAGTVHSFGFNALRKFQPNIKVDETKVAKIIGDVPFADTIRQIVSLAKQRAVGVDGNRIDDFAQYEAIIEHFDLMEDSELFDVSAIIEICIRVLKESNKQTAIVDFDDMVYLPLVLPVRFWQFDTIIIDEAQDTNPARRLLARRMLRPGGRIAAVGDKHQAIYGFTGADSDSLELIRKAFRATEMPLTVTYRCPKAVVQFARQWVDHIQAHESNDDGEVITDAQNFETFIPDQGSAILCRNTAPLVKGAFKLIRRKIACQIEGRDIAKGIIKLINKWKTTKTIDTYEKKLDAWYRDQIAKLEGNNDKRLEFIADQVETIRVVIEQAQKEGKTQRDDLVKVIESLFADNVEGVVTLSTIHKSKGREWGTVYWLNRAATCPSKYAVMEWQKEQELNLCYVAATRAQKRLIELTME